MVCECCMCAKWAFVISKFRKENWLFTAPYINFLDHLGRYSDDLFNVTSFIHEIPRAFWLQKHTVFVPERTWESVLHRGLICAKVRLLRWDFHGSHFGRLRYLFSNPIVAKNLVLVANVINIDQFNYNTSVVFYEELRKNHFDLQSYRYRR